MTDVAEERFSDRWIIATIKGLIGEEKLAEVVASETAKSTLWETVVDMGFATDEDLLGSLATRFRIKLADISQAERQTREIVPEAVAKKYGILPVRMTDSYLEIATSNPFDLDCEKTLAFATGREIRLLLASPSRIAEKAQEFYRPERVLDSLIEGLDNEAEVLQLKDEEADDLDISAEEASQRPVVRLVDLILSEGVAAKASDIHIEPEEGGIAVRYRIDGVLRQVMKIPRTAGLPLISRIKIMSGLDIADRRRPQDGRARVGVNGVPVDLRISTLPATLGEKVVIRILDQSTTILALDSLGFNPGEADLIKELLDTRDGIILVTGPTGSGKTTTLYSALRHVQSEGVNIVTVEDPVEYRLQGVVQVQVHEKAGLTFAAALRSILRQDPDIVLVGEIRDKETGSIAIQASLTGHLVLSTLHTNDAANAVIRLQDIGIEGHKTAAALRGVVAQRLMRRLCSSCKEAWVEEVPEKLRRWVPEGTPLVRSVGCPECAMTGYQGRFAIIEVLKVNTEIEKLIARDKPADAIAEAARKSGMKSLWDSGLQHVLRGATTIDELLRVVEVPGDEDLYTDAEIELRASGEVTAPVLPQGLSKGNAADIIVPTEDLERRASRATAMKNRDSLVGGFDIVGTETPASTEGNHSAISVLLVDDEDQLRRVMRDLLERDGYNVIEAVDGVEALDKVDQHAPDVIVLDLNLPNLDGYGVLTRLKSRPETASIPVIVLTANRDEDNEVRVFEHGATDFLSKPFRARALSARLRAVVARAGLK